MSQLPAFPEATIGDTLDIRQELSDPLVRFRSAVTKVGSEIRTNAYGMSIDEEIEQLYHKEVAPSLLEIHESIQENATFRRFLGTVARDSTPFVGGVLALGVGYTHDLPNLLTLGTGVALGALKPLINSMWKHIEGEREASHRELYFLYQMNELLAKER